MDKKIEERNKMHDSFIATKIEDGFEEERKILNCESDQKPNQSILAYVRPVFFTVLLIITLFALGINIITVIKYFVGH